MVTVHRASPSTFAAVFGVLLAARSAQAAPPPAGTFTPRASASSAEPLTRLDAPELRAAGATPPALDLRASGYFFKLDLPVGRTLGFTTAGLGIYPVNVGHFFQRAGLFSYLSLGGTASVILSGASSDPAAPKKIVGGVAQGRAAVGLKLSPARGFALSAELCYSSWAVGGMVVEETTAEPTASAAAGGLGRIIDLSVGVEWL